MCTKKYEYYLVYLFMYRGFLFLYSNYVLLGLKDSTYECVVCNKAQKYSYNVEDFQTNFNILGRVVTQSQERDDDVAVAEELFLRFQMVIFFHLFLKLVKELLTYLI